jgi:outer membrane protein assembly factor BamA
MLRAGLKNSDCSLKRGGSLLGMILLLSGLAFAPAARGQQSSKSQPGRLSRIEFSGLVRLKEEQVVAASGLKIGQMIDVPVLDAASQRLIDSGLLKKLSYRYHVDNGQVVVTFTVEEARAGVPVVFDNFVWFSDEELLNAIRQDVPTFDGTVPESGNLTDQIAQALERVLRARNIPGQVEYKHSADPSGANAKLIFSATGVALPLCSLSFPGAGDIAEAELVKNSKELLAGDYSQEFAAEFAKSNLIPLYQEKGHLRARFLSPSAKLGNGKDCKNGVAVTLPVEEGLIYSWNKAEWEGARVIPASELESVLAMRTGEVANGVKFTENLKAVRELYGRKGYLALRLKAAPDFDDAARRVVYRISVTEGPQFRMGTLTVNGLPEAEAARLKSKWKLQTGDIYDSSYTKDFLKKAMPEMRGAFSSIPKGVSTQEKPDLQKLTVDVVITFK